MSKARVPVENKDKYKQGNKINKCGSIRNKKKKRCTYTA
jgi:hypothetical protein